MIVSILIGAALYTLLQFAFIGSLDPRLLVEHTWTGLGSGSIDPAVVALNAGPFYAIASVAGLAWIAFILRLDAVVSPFGSGLIYLTTSSRISHALSRNGYIPEQFGRTSRRTLVGGLLASAVWSLVIYRLAIALRLPEAAATTRGLVDSYHSRARRAHGLRGHGAHGDPADAPA